MDYFLCVANVKCDIYSSLGYYIDHSHRPHAHVWLCAVHCGAFRCPVPNPIVNLFTSPQCLFSCLSPALSRVFPLCVSVNSPVRLFQCSMCELVWLLHFVSLILNFQFNVQLFNVAPSTAAERGSAVVRFVFIFIFTCFLSLPLSVLGHLRNSLVYCEWESVVCVHCTRREYGQKIARSIVFDLI